MTPTSDPDQPRSVRSGPVLLALVVALCAWVGGPTMTVDRAAADEIEAGPQFPRVVWLEDPAHRAAVVWTTREKGDDHRLYFDTESRDGDTTAYRYEVEVERTVSESQDHVWFHHAVIEGLHPSTTYYFTAESDGTTTAERHFETAPADDRPFKLLYGGDSRSDPENRRKVNRRIRKLHSSDDAIIGLVHGGDYVESGMAWDQWRQWLRDWELTTTDDGKVIPVVPARGNHEFSPLQGNPERADNYNAMFGLPGGRKLDRWVTEIGSQVAIVTLDTNTAHGGEQRAWLDRTLDDLTDERKWILPSYHRPAYPAVKRPGDARQHWVPLFEKYNVDLVLESDGHVLKRTVPIRDGEQAEDGIVYVGEGGLGVKQRSPRDRWYLQEPGMATATHHIQVLSFGPDQLRYRAVVLDGSTADEATFEPRRAGSPVPIEIDAIHAPSSGRIEVDFSKGIAPDSIDAEDFSLAPSVEISAASLHDDYDDFAVLETADLADDTGYTLTVSGVSDLLGNRLEGDLTAEFTRGDSEMADKTDSATPADDTESADTGGGGDETDNPTGGQSGGASAGNCTMFGPGPLPVTFLLLVVGFSALGLARWRR